MGDYSSTKELQKGHRQYFDCGEQYVFDPDMVTAPTLLIREQSLPTVMICAGATSGFTTIPPAARHKSAVRL